jgi:nucleotide-binding universal stress UspA family protein
VFARIVACVDASPTGLRALEAGIEMAARFGCALTLLTVLPEGASDVGADLESLVPSHEGGRPLRQTITEAVEAAKHRGAAEADGVYLRGKAVDEILRYLGRTPVDLVVVGTRGLSRGSRLLLGSVSSRLVAEAPCPVLVVRPVTPVRRSAR